MPILLTSEVEHWLELLVAFRDAAGVISENIFLFPRSNSQSLFHIRGCDVIRIWSAQSGAKHPELLRSTKLRKQIATISQIVNLKDNELDLLANFLGHDIRTHRQYYRLPHEVLQAAKVAKLLLAAERGEPISGLTLDEINIAVDEGERLRRSLLFQISLYFIFLSL